MTTPTALSFSTKDLLDRFVRCGRNKAPGILVDAILTDAAPEDGLALLVAEAWTMAEYPTRHEEPFVWISLFKRIGYCNAAGQSIDRPKKPITVWRGASLQEELTRDYGMSWTTDRNKAQWFAKRFNCNETYVYRAEAHPEALLADYRDSERNESEIIVNPALISSPDIEEF